MKTPNKNVTKVVAGTLAASLLASSCQSFIPEDSFTDQTSFSEKGEAAILINYSPEELEYLIFLEKLSNDIIEHPVIAKEFVKNPNLFLKRYGYDKEIDLDEGMLKLILALGDNDINEALRNNDIKAVLLLMKEKNLLDSNSYMNITVSDEERNKVLALFNVDEKDFEQYGACSLAVVCIAYLWVGVVSQAAAVFSVAAAVNAALAFTVAKYVAAVTEVEIAGFTPDQNTKLFLDKNPIFKIWGLKGEYANSYIAADVYLEELVDDIAEGLEASVPEAFEKISKDTFKQFMKLNMLKSNQ